MTEANGREEPAAAHGDAEVIVCTPTGRDAALITAVLTGVGIRAVGAPTCAAATRRPAGELGCIVLASEAIDADASGRLTDWLDEQPAWSDLPILLLVSRAAPFPPSLEPARERHNLTLFERPLPSASLASAVRSALRARGHQHEVRRRLQELEQRERLLRLLNHELSHRVKNTLATVTSLAHATARQSREPGGFLPAFRGRLASLARAHSLLTRESWAGASLRDLVRDSLEPYVRGETGRVVVHGPDVMLEAKPALTLAMVLHELATNAAKHGALREGSGRVRVSWMLTDETEASACEVRLDWAEEGGPPVRPPTQRGFGSELLDGAISYDLRGTSTVSFDPSGLRCSIRFPCEAGIARAPATAWGKPSEDCSPKAGPEAGPAGGDQ